MLTRAKLNTLVERVVRRLSEAVPPPATAKAGNFRYNAAGESIPDEQSATSPTTGTTPTQMPPTQHPPTMPAARSTTQQQADAETQGSTISRNPMARPNTQKTNKVNNIKKALDAQGYTADPAKAKHVTQSLNAWYDQLDPSDALVATADELALRFAGEG